jgi:cytochrome c
MKYSRRWAIIPLAAGLFAGFSGPAEIWADELYEYGEYLSSECTTCHLLSGQSDGIPSIIGWPEDKFITALGSYKDGQQENEAMRNVAKRLTNEDIKALAVFFNRQGH